MDGWLSVGWHWLGENEAPVVAAFTILLFAATTALALATFGLFRKTFDVASATHQLAGETKTLAKLTAAVAEETLEASKLADQHHQESLTPLLVFDGDMTTIPTPQETLWRDVVANGIIRNDGLGLAFECELSIMNVGETLKVGPVGRKQSTRVDYHVPMLFTHEARFSSGPWHLIIKYQNFVGELIVTEHFGRFGEAVFSTVFTPPQIRDRIFREYGPPDPPEET